MYSPPKVSAVLFLVCEFADKYADSMTDPERTLVKSAAVFGKAIVVYLVATGVILAAKLRGR